MIIKLRKDLPKKVALQVVYINWLKNNPTQITKNLVQDIKVMQDDKYWYYK